MDAQRRRHERDEERFVFSDLESAGKKEEHQLLGDGGFERIVDEVAQIEAALRIDNLVEFTPS